MSDLLGRLNRIQQSLAFKAIASGVVVLLTVAAIVWYAVEINKERGNLPFQQVNPSLVDSILGGAPEGGKPDGNREEAAKAIRDSAQTMVKSVNAILERRLSMVAFGLGAAVVLAVLLTVIWLGVALTYLAALSAGCAVCIPLFMYGTPWWRGVATFIAGATALAMSFSAFVQAVRLLLAPTGPITGIAQNVINEAVRMKISLVFVVMLILAMAALPGLLDESAPLRYRVQAFLSYGCEGAFWIIALLVLFLSTATVTYEQRDKIIWQTMTKPVKPWEYVLGKWLGVTLMSGVLLGVSSTGIFLFTEYLRNQPAQGEIRAFLPARYNEGESITQDRLILETQVLTARKAVTPVIPPLDPKLMDAELDARMARAKQTDQFFQETTEARDKMREDMVKEFASRWMTIAPGGFQRYRFLGLESAKESGAPVTLRFKVNAGSNNPTDTYKLTFVAAGLPPFVLNARLDQFLSEPLPPLAVQLIDDPATGRKTGVIDLDIFNGDGQTQTRNAESVTFPTSGLEVFYPAGDFRANFLKIVLILWLKLSFLAMVGVAAGTGLSFPVASLLSFGVLFAAEGAKFLTEALQTYDVYDMREFLWWRVPIVYIAQGVSTTFWFYGNLQPLERLAEGRVVTWLNVFTAALLLGGLSAVLWAVGSFVFRRRELAMYSGA